MRLRHDPPLQPSAYPFRHVARVRFAETDAMGVVHHGAYPLYLESARVEYLRDLGRPYHVIREEDAVEFPVAELWVGYRRPLRFDDLVDVWVNVATARAATFEMGYLLCVDGEAHATAVTVHAVVTREGRPVRTPGWLRDLAAGRPGPGHPEQGSGT